MVISGFLYWIVMKIWWTLVDLLLVFKIFSFPNINEGLVPSIVNNNVV
jgi:hypothetical protein